MIMMAVLDDCRHGISPFRDYNLSIALQVEQTAKKSSKFKGIHLRFEINQMTGQF
jgi:hypothetical protein